MKWIVVFFMCCSFSPSFSQVSLAELRDCQSKVKADEEYAIALLQRLEALTSPTNVELGYWGVVEAMMAEHTINPMKKLSYFNNGKDRLENAIDKETTNVELRYLRLAIQLNTPAFLGYKGAIESDKTTIIQHIKSQKKELGAMYSKIIAYLLESKICTESEKNILEKLN